MNLSVSAGSIGERIVLAVVVLGLVAEMLSDNWNVPTPVTLQQCQEVCWAQETLVRRVEGYACECETRKGRR